MQFSTIFILCFLFCTNLFSQAILTDNFDNLTNWTLYGAPLPKHVSSIFGKTGVFDNNGDSWHNSGAISKQTYNISTGFILESEVYLDFSNLEGCWASAEIGIANPAYQSWGGYESYISFSLIANGEACWGSPAGTRRRAIISGGYKTSTGWETIGDLSTAPIYADQYANSWKILKIVVDPNRMPKFYISNTLIYTGTQPIDASVMSTNRPIWLGARSSGSAGKAYHDWIKLSPYTTTNVKDDGIYDDLHFTLFQNYPNPFNPSTTIKYGLPHSAHVTLSIYNTLGQRVAVLVDDKKEAGYNEATLSRENLSSGMYFYRIIATPSNGGDPFVETKKMLLIR